MKDTKHMKMILMSIFMVFSGLQLFAQELTITGTVIDKLKEPIIGANVVVQGTTSGTITDFDGNFSLSNVPANGKLVVSYIGMQSQIVDVKGKTTFSITLDDNAQALDEVVVVGFGAQKKENLTGAVAAVKMSEVLGDRPVSSAAAALQGTVPGLQVSGGSMPGQTKTFNIRGQMSINGGAPLVLIDNVEGDIDMINPEDIESISVLKDAASSAIYGARAANGVILVTTKRPKSGAQFKLNYNNNFGFQNAINRPESVGLDTYLEMYQQAGFDNNYWAGTQNVTKWRQYLQEYKKNPSAFNTIGDNIFVDADGILYYLNENPDPYSDMLETGFMMNHNLSMSGSSDKVRYRISGGYNSNDGPLKSSKDKYQRINLASFLSVDFTKWFTQEIDIKYSRATQNLLVDENGNFNAYLFNTKQIPYGPQGMVPAEIIPSSDVDLPSRTPLNIIKNSNPSETVKENPRIFLKSIFKPVKNFDVVLEYTYDKNLNNMEYYANKWTSTSIQMNTSTPSNDYYIVRNRRTNYNALNIYGSYSYSYKNNNFKAMAGFNQESSDYQQTYNKAMDLLTPESPSIQASTGEKTSKTNIKQFSTRGGFFRLNWNYNSRYMLEVNGRYDGSSKFPTNSRFGFFPSVSGGWQIAEESWMEASRSWLDALKLRASWGQIGNQNVEPYLYYSTMEAYTNQNWLLNGQYQAALPTPGLISADFTWETVSTADFGLDWTMLNGRLRGGFDWYRRITTGMITSGVELPAVVGTSAPKQNAAEMRTDGWEVNLNWNDKIGKVTYRVGVNLYDKLTKITKINNESGSLFATDGTNLYYSGYKWGTIYGYTAEGYYTENDFENGKLKDGIPYPKGKKNLVKPGDVKFKDLDGNGEIDPGQSTLSNMGDRKVIGNNDPRLQFGGNLGVNYEGFDLNIMFQGTGKRDYWLGNAYFPFQGEATSNTAAQTAIFSHQTDCWTPENQDARFFRISDFNGEMYQSNIRVSDKYLQNAAYLRIKNITLSYSFKKELLKKIRLDQLKVFGSMENVATFSSLPDGYDPERLSWGYPFFRTVSFGINASF